MAAYLLYTGERIDATQAKAIGLVDLLVKDDTLDAETARVAGLIARNRLEALVFLKAALRMADRDEPRGRGGLRARADRALLLVSWIARRGSGPSVTANLETRRRRGVGMAAFVSAAEAAAQVRDEATVVLSGNTYRLVAESVLTALEARFLRDGAALTAASHLPDHGGAARAGAAVRAPA